MNVTKFIIIFVLTEVILYKLPFKSTFYKILIKLFFLGILIKLFLPWIVKMSAINLIFFSDLRSRRENFQYRTIRIECLLLPLIN